MIYEACKRNKNIEYVELLCPGLKDWKYENKNRPISEIIFEKYNDYYYFDIIILLPGNTFNIEFYKRKHRDEIKKTALFMALFEGFDYCSLTTLDSYGIDITFYPSNNELLDDYNAKFPSWEKMVVAQMTQVADKNFYHDASNKRNINVLNCGFTNMPDFYPLRTRFTEMINNKEIDAVIREHPGYTLPIKDTYILNKKVDPDCRDVEIENYKKQLTDTKILLVGASIRRCLMTKVCEGTLAGALIIGNIPYDDENTLKKFIVEVNMNHTNEYIKNIIKYWLEHDEERIMRVKIGQQIILEKYTWDIMTNKLVECYNKWINQEYCVMFTEFVSYRSRYKNKKEIPKIEKWYTSYLFL